MTSIVDDVVAIKARLDEIDREKDAARNKQEPAATYTYEGGPWVGTPVHNPDNEMYC